MLRVRCAPQAVVLLVSAGALLSTPAAGDVTDGLIDTFAIHKKKGIQSPVSVAYNSRHEEYLAVWSDEKDRRVYGRRIRLHPHEGRVIRPKQVISAVTGMPGQIALAYNSNQDTYLVVWTAFTARYRDQRIWSTIVDAHGRPLGVGWEMTEIPEEEWCTPFSPGVTYNSVEDSWLVFWQDNCFYTDGTVARIISGDGSSVGPVVRLHNRGLWPGVAFNPVHNEYLVVRQRGSRIKGQFHGPAGEKLGPQFVVARRRPPFYQEYPSVAWIPGTDRWLVVWREGGDLRSAIVDRLGVLPPVVISEDSGPCIWACNPSLSYSPANKEMLVVWDNGNDIFSRWVDRIGNPRGSARLLLSGDLHGTTPQGACCSWEKPHCLIAWDFAGPKGLHNDFNVFGGLLRVAPEP